MFTAGKASLRSCVLKVCHEFARSAGGGILLSVVWLSGCGYPSIRPGPSTLTDPSTVDMKQIQPGTSSKTDVAALMGQPLFVYEEPWGTEWHFPVRALSETTGRTRPAPVLKVWFDETGRAVDYAFYHQQTSERLPVAETREDTETWYRGICNPPARILLASAIKKGVSTRQDVENALIPWPAETVKPRWLRQRRIMQQTADGREILTFPVDRPSLYYVPPFYVEVLFRDGIVQTWGFHGYGGCK